MRELLTRAIETTLPSTPSSELLPSVANPTDAPITYGEVLDFLITRPIPQKIVAFKVSAEAQERIHTLLDKNREGMLTEIEAALLPLTPLMPTCKGGYATNRVYAFKKGIKVVLRNPL